MTCLPTGDERRMTEDRMDSVEVSDPEQGQVLGEEADLAYLDLEEQDGPAIDVEDAPGPEPRGRRGCLWWLAAVAVCAVALSAVLGLVGAMLYNFGTMETPSERILAEFDQMVARQEASPGAKSPGFRIPIPGCRCHAADPDVGIKDPGRKPDVTIVIGHRYLTISQCSQCHGGGKEPSGIEGQPLEDAPAQ
jgi:hypothetical protein